MAKAGRNSRSTNRTSPGQEASSDLRELAQRIVDLTVAADAEATLDLYADSIQSTEAGGKWAGEGLGALRKKYDTWRDTVTHSTFRARNVWVDGNTIIIEWAARVTFAATGRTVDLTEVAIHEVEDGKIVRERFYYDRTVLQP